MNNVGVRGGSPAATETPASRAAAVPRMKRVIAYLLRFRSMNPVHLCKLYGSIRPTQTEFTLSLFFL